MEAVHNESVTGHELLDVYEADPDIESDENESDDDKCSDIEFDTLESDTPWASNSESCGRDDHDDWMMISLDLHDYRKFMSK